MGSERKSNACERASGAADETMRSPRLAMPPADYGATASKPAGQVEGSIRQAHTRRADGAVRAAAGLADCLLSPVPASSVCRTQPKRQWSNRTKNMAKSANSCFPVVEVGLVCDAGTSLAGIHGLTDLFTYAADMLRQRKSGVPPAPVRIVHWRLDDERNDVTSSSDSHPDLPHAPAVLIIPGNLRATRQSLADSALVPWIRERHAEGSVIAGVCGGVFLLAETGLLAGRQATTHWALSSEFSARFPDVLVESDHMVIDYGDVVTAGGVLAWADLGLRLTERLLGHDIMLATARYMLMDPPGREQRYYSEFAPRTRHGDEVILKVQNWLWSQREQSLSVADLADHACLEVRTFLRRFSKATGMKPSEYQQRLRISRAREMLEFSQRRIEEIAASVGYADPARFRRVFRKIIGLTPTDYRRRFCGHPGNRIGATDQPSVAAFIG
jgi:transcriptional regulator GlxA family with amidase domain